MESEHSFTIKDIYEIVVKRFDVLEAKIEKYNDNFIEFEKGRLTDLIKEVAVLKEQNEKEDTNLLKVLTTEILKSVILAVVAGLMFLLIKNQF